MESEILSERECQRQIFALRKAINLHLSVGNGDEANLMREQIGNLERRIQEINERERASRLHGEREQK